MRDRARGLRGQRPRRSRLRDPDPRQPRRAGHGRRAGPDHRRAALGAGWRRAPPGGRCGHRRRPRPPHQPPPASRARASAPASPATPTPPARQPRRATAQPERGRSRRLEHVRAAARPRRRTDRRATTAVRATARWRSRDRAPRDDRKGSRPDAAGGGRGRRRARLADHEREEIQAAEASPEALAAGTRDRGAAGRPHGLPRRRSRSAPATPSKIDVSGVDDEEREALGALIGRKGERLSALQHLVNLMLSRRMGAWTRVLVDVEDYRGRRERQLGEIAPPRRGQGQRERHDAPAGADARPRAPLDPPRAARRGGRRRPSPSARSRCAASSC